MGEMARDVRFTPTFKLHAKRTKRVRWDAIKILNESSFSRTGHFLSLHTNSNVELKAEFN